jgi:hypothetical protein
MFAMTDLMPPRNLLKVKRLASDKGSSASEQKSGIGQAIEEII